MTIFDFFTTEYPFVYRKPVTPGRNSYVFPEVKAWFLGVPYITPEYCIVDEMLKAFTLKSRGCPLRS